MLHDLLGELSDRNVTFHLAGAKGPVRDVLRRAGLWASLGDRVHASTHDALAAITAARGGPHDQRQHGIDERRSNRSTPIQKCPSPA